MGEPLHGAFSNMGVKLDLSVCEGKYCGAHFYLHARHTGAWFGEQATGKKVRLRCGTHAHLEGGRIVEGWLIIDVPRAFADMGVDFFARPVMLLCKRCRRHDGNRIVRLNCFNSS